MGHEKDHTPRLEPLEPRILLSGTPELLDSATALAVTTPVDMDFSGQIDLPRQSDVYEFTVDATSDLVVDMFAEDGMIDPVLRLYNAQGRLIRRNNNAYRGTVDSRLAYTLRPGNTYYIRAYARSKTTGEYSIRLRTTLVDEFGDSLGEADALELSRSGRKRAAGSVDYAADVDVVRFVASRTGTVTVQQRARFRRYEPIDCVLYAYDGAGSLLTDNEATVGLSESTSNTISFEVSEGQEYYLALTGHNGTTGRYKLKIKTKRIKTTQPQPPPAPQPDPDPPVDILPGESVAVHTFQSDGYLHLLVLGTDLPDSISVGQTAQGLTVASGSGTEVFGGAYSTVVVYGFGGNDVIRITNSVTAAEWIHGGDGDDWIFDAGQGVGDLCGGAGDDLLVGVGGGVDAVHGQDGLDSFWVDGADVISDASAPENSATAVHRISEFYQPYTTRSSSPGYVSLEIAGQDLIDPTITSYAVGYANFADRPAFVDGASYDDVVQGAIGDCYMLASLASLAESDPQLIEQMIAPLGDGTFAVRFYDRGTPVYVRVDGDLPITGSGALAYADLGGGGELWVALAEKAYAHFRYGENSYGSLHGGWMSDVYYHTTAQAAIYRSTGALGEQLYAFVESQLAAGHALTLGSYYTASWPIVPSHAYMIKAVSVDESGQQYVTVYNPWGVDGRSWDDNYSDGLLTLTTAQVVQHFSAIVACYA